MKIIIILTSSINMRKYVQWIITLPLYLIAKYLGLKIPKLLILFKYPNIRALAEIIKTASFCNLTHFPLRCIHGSDLSEVHIKNNVELYILTILFYSNHQLQDTRSDTEEDDELYKEEIKKMISVNNNSME